ASCPNQPGLTKVCTRFSENPLSGRCEYSAPRVILVDDASTPLCEQVLTSENLRLGDGAVSANWSGAGTNGNLNDVALSISCGATPNMWIQQYAAMFAGINLIHTVMPTRVGNDTHDTSTRGQSFAAQYVANNTSSIGASWSNALNTTTGGNNCVFGGGGHGISGCGANVTMALSDDQASAIWSLNTYSWTLARNENFDQQSGGWMSVSWMCNYDCNAHPWTL
ncbi:MAG TPA: hypothetical protein VJR89_11820, partial [Polyangiales bacterium]|nr:hypothetical protein [Polyangiales bacterium]